MPCREIDARSSRFARHETVTWLYSCDVGELGQCVEHTLDGLSHGGADLGGPSIEAGLVNRGQETRTRETHGRRIC